MNKNKTLAALIPAYDSDGMNTTVAIYEDMSAENLKVSIRTAVSRLFRDKLADEKGYRKWAKTVAEKKTGLALVIRDTRLVGIRCRELRSKGDGSMIYLNRKLIYDIEDGYVHLEGLTKIPVLAKKRTIRERIKDCDRISAAYDQKFGDWVPRVPNPFLCLEMMIMAMVMSLRRWTWGHNLWPQDKLKEEKKKESLVSKKDQFLKQELGKMDSCFKKIKIGKINCLMKKKSPKIV